MLGNLFLDENWLDYNENIQVGNLDLLVRFERLGTKKTLLISQKVRESGGIWHPDQAMKKSPEG